MNSQDNRKDDEKDVETHSRDEFNQPCLRGPLSPEPATVVKHNLEEVDR